MAAIRKGRCFCGAVQFEAEGEPAFQGYCHCADCRAWSGTPVTAFAMWPTAATRFTAGEALVISFQRQEGGGAVRRSCSRCGGAVPTEAPSLGMTDVYPFLLEDFSFVPAVHIQCAESVLPIEDGLPHFDRWPTQG